MMVLGIELPEGSTARIDRKNNRVLIIFDEAQTSSALWKAQFPIELVPGKNIKEFLQGEAVADAQIEVTKSNKLRCVRGLKP